MRLSICALCAASLLIFAGTATATPIGEGGGSFSLKVTVDGDTQTVPLVLNADGTGFDLRDGKWSGSYEGGSVTVDSANGVFDPVLNLGIGVTDFGPASSFIFSLVSPLVPTLFGVVDYDIFLVGGFTDGASDGGSLTADGMFGTMDVSLNGVDIDGVGVDAIFPTPGAPYGPFSKSDTFDCGVAGCTSFDINFEFTGSGDNDTYTLNGRFEVVPEPSTAALLAIGLIGLAARRRR